jgi:hypothetical protein
VAGSLPVPAEWASLLVPSGADWRVAAAVRLQARGAREPALARVLAATTPTKRQKARSARQTNGEDDP